MGYYFVHIDKEKLFYVVLAVVVAVALVFVYSDKIWNTADRALTPYVDEGENMVVASSGSADAEVIRKIHIAWERGDVSIAYSPHERIIWRESYTQGIPSEFNMQQYWMNTQTLFINYVSHEFYAETDPTRREIAKNLQVFVPKGIVMDELVVTANGEVHCEVEAKVKEIKDNFSIRATE